MDVEYGVVLTPPPDVQKQVDFVSKKIYDTWIEIYPDIPFDTHQLKVCEMLDMPAMRMVWEVTRGDKTYTACTPAASGVQLLKLVLSELGKVHLFIQLIKQIARDMGK